MWADFPKFKHRKQAIYRGPGGSGDATDDAANAAELVLIKVAEAAASATAASLSADEAASSAAAALISEDNAATSENNAASSAALAAGFFPSATGNTGKYLRTNGTTNYWDVVTDVNAATPLNDGLVFGKTDPNDPVWSGTINNFNLTNPSGYYTLVNCSTQAILSLANGSPFADACYGGQVVAGQQISINDGTSTLNFGTVVSVDLSAGQPLVTTSVSGWGAIGVTLKYIYQIILIGSTGGNVGLGKSIYSSLNNGVNNTVIGHKAGASVVDGNNNIVIGYNANTSSTSAANEVTIGNTDITKTRLRGAILVGNSSPSAGTSGQVLTSNGSSSEPSWTTPAAGTVTSVALSAPTGLTVSGSPVTSSGTLTLSYTTGYSIPTDTKQTNWDSAYTDRLKWDGGATGLVAATGRTSLGLVIGTDIPSVSGSGATGTWGISITGNAATVTNGLYSTGSYSNPTWLTSVAGSIVSGNISGNAVNVTGTVAVANGGTGSTTSSGARTNLGLVIGTDVPSPTGTGASGTWGISITGNAATVTNGLYSTGSYSDPTWLTTLAGSKISGTINGGTY